MSRAWDQSTGRHLRVLFNVGAVRELSDGQLLERFATHRGETSELAFAALVDRHGPMVWRVCRGVLSDEDDSHDAFQATFLVLIQKARGLWVRESIGPWLNQVAYRTATCTRATSARRRRLESRAAVSGVATDDRPDELASAVHEELARLPERFRAAIVLCDLEGCSHEQAATQLGWPIGTVKSRLARGRDRLRSRLLRRGLAPEASLLASAECLDSTDTALPFPDLVASTIQTGLHVLHSRALTPSAATILAREVIRTMTMTQRLKVVSLLLAIGATASGVVVVAQSDRPGEAPPPTVTDKRLAQAPLSLVERGRLEPSASFDLVSEVEGSRTIRSIVAEGSHVKAGEIVCELDVSALSEERANATEMIDTAKQDHVQAQQELAAAELALTEYVQGIHPAKLARLSREDANLRATIERSEKRVERVQNAAKRIEALLLGNASDILADLSVQDRLDDARQILAREMMELDSLQIQRNLVQTHEFPRTVVQLKAEVQKLKKVEIEKAIHLKRQTSRASRIEKQVAASTMKSPIDGIVEYATATGRPSGSAGTRVRIEEGATVHNNQHVLTIGNLDRPMRVHLWVRGCYELYPLPVRSLGHDQHP